MPDFAGSSTIFIGLISYRIFSPFAVVATFSVASQTVFSFAKHSKFIISAIVPNRKILLLIPNLTVHLRKYRVFRIIHGIAVDIFIVAEYTIFRSGFVCCIYA